MFQIWLLWGGNDARQSGTNPERRRRISTVQRGAMADSLLRIFGRQGLQFGLGTFVLEISRLCLGKDCSELCLGIGGGHVDNPDGLNSRFRWIDPEQTRGLAILDTAPESPLGDDKQVLV